MFIKPGKPRPLTQKTLIFTGGINENLSNLEMKPGECLDLVNYEEISGEFHGYRSTRGYERIDGWDRWFPDTDAVDQLTDGDFNFPIYWSGVNWSITGGQAVTTAPTSDALYNLETVLVPEVVYLIEFEVVSVAAGSIQFREDTATSVDSPGVYQFEYTTGAIEESFYLKAAAFDGVIDNCRMYLRSEIGQYQFPSDVPLVWTSEAVADDTAREAFRAGIQGPGGHTGYLKGAFDYDDSYFVIWYEETSGTHLLYRMADNSTGWEEITSFPSVVESGAGARLNYHFNISRFATYPVATTGVYPNTDVVVMCNSVSPAIVMYKDTSGTETVYTCVSLVESNGPEFDGSYTVRLPSDPSIDEGFPSRSITFNQRLHLAFDHGTLFVSEAGDPFFYDNAIGSAGVWWLNSDITDMFVTPSSLAVFMERGVDIIKIGDPDQVTGFDEYKETFSDRSGAKANTAQRILGRTIFCDDRGITSLETTDRYGDFSISNLSKKVYRTYRNNKDSIIGTALDRDNNQYILYFSNGYGIVLTLELNYRGDFTVRSQTVFNLGTNFSGVWGVYKEPKILLFKDTDDYLRMQHEDASSFDGNEIVCTFTTAFHPYGTATRYKTFSRLLLELNATRGQVFNVRTLFDYNNPDVPKASLFTTEPQVYESLWGEGVWGTFTWGGTGAVDQEYSYIAGVGVNMAIQFSNSSKWHVPHEVQNAIVSYSVGNQKF